MDEGSGAAPSARGSLRRTPTNNAPTDGLSRFYIASVLLYQHLGIAQQVPIHPRIERRVHAIE